MTDHFTDSLRIVPLASLPIDQVLPMIVGAMRDNPQHIAAFGPDERERERLLGMMFGMMAANPALFTHSLAAVLDGRLVGVCGLVAPGKCQPTTGQRLRMLPGLLRLGLGNARRAGAWLGAWARKDPAIPHWHIGPVAVAADLQGHGIGSQLMQAGMAVVDASGQMAYLETDKEINVRFYERVGFQVVSTETVIGTRNWFMSREPQPALTAEV
jgi:ribosomal protein S18 acetylase RimI-like enzyme